MIGNIHLAGMVDLRDSFLVQEYIAMYQGTDAMIHREISVYHSINKRRVIPSCHPINIRQPVSNTFLSLLCGVLLALESKAAQKPIMIQILRAVDDIEITDNVFIRKRRVNS